MKKKENVIANIKNKLNPIWALIDLMKLQDENKLHDINFNIVIKDLVKHCDNNRDIIIKDLNNLLK